MRLATGFNTVSDWIGMPLLIIAMLLIIVGELRPSRWTPTWLQVVAATLAVGFIGLRFVIMI